MSGFFDSLSIATSALSAYRSGLDVAGQNIANVNTPGYARRQVVLGEVAPNDPQSPGNGVEILRVQALRDQSVESRLNTEQSGQAHDGAVLDGLTEVETAIGAPGNSIDANLSSFFDSFSSLASDPTSTSARDQVVKQGQVLAQGFNSMTGRIDQLRTSSDAAIRDGVTQLNQLTTQVASLNAQIAQGGPQVDTLIDQRSTVISQIAQIADVTVLPQQADGTVTITLKQGQALVVGATSNAVSVSSTPPAGYASLSVSDLDVTSSITGGQLGGLLQLRDSVLPGYQGQLDQLAYDVATQVNAIHQTGYDATGAAAGEFFSQPASVAGAAASMAVDPNVVANSEFVAASATGAIGDNQIAQALTSLRDARAMSGGTATPSEAWSKFVYQVGSDVATATSASSTRDAVVQQLQTLRDQTSGVSLDEEAANLMKFQRSYEASARFFTTVNTTLDSLMAMVQ